MPKLHLTRQVKTPFIEQHSNSQELEQKLNPSFHTPSLKLTPSPYISEKALSKRWSKLGELTQQSLLLDTQTL